MKKTKILSLLLCLSLFCALIVPGTRAYADNAPDSGMKISKTATANNDGSYTITLEAFATGSKTTTVQEKDIPTDIILVLDQSGSMADDIGRVQYTAYTGDNTQNKSNYEKRHNGGSANLWHKLPDGSFVSVSVTLQQTITYEKITKGRNDNGSDGYTNYWENRNNLYTYVNGEIKKVVYTRERDWVWENYKCTYALEDGTILNQNNEGSRHSPTFQNTDDGYLYLAVVNENQNVYTYTYTDTSGTTQTIGTSTGANTRFTPVFYQRSTTTSGGGSRLNALKSAATSFANQVATKANGTDGFAGTDDDVKHRIAVVGYAGSSSNLTNGFKQMNNTSQAADVSSAIDNLTANGGTHIDQGLSTANGIFANNPIVDTENRNRVVIVFTDGAPGSYGDWCSESVQTANNAIAYAKTAKKPTSEGGYGATVYTIGIFSGADASNPDSLPAYTSYTTGWLGSEQSPSEADQVKNSNRFMHLVSSNYPAASSITQPGSINPNLNGKSYYLSAADSGALNSIFQQISDQIETGGAETTLGSETVVKDIISPYFTLPAGTTASGIQIDTYDCTGKTGDTYTWSNTSGGSGGASATVSGDQVSVTGFNFSENWCGTETDAQGNTSVRGKKLVISFEVSPKSGFLGGNEVITNASAGIYENGSAQTPVMTFEQPKVNVPIEDVTVTATDKNVYLKGEVTANQLKDGSEISVGDVKLDLSKATDTDKPYGLDPWQTEYVDITVTVKDKDGNVISDKLENLTEDTTYTVEVTVSPKTAGISTSEKGDAATAKTGVNDPAASIYVFKPELTFKDSTAYYGESVPANNNYSGNKVGSETWKHGDTVSTDVTMLGTKPTMDISYTPDESKLESGKYTKQDVPVSATVKIGTENVNEHTTFVHQDCTTACGWETPATPGAPAFLIHIQTCTLNITKAGNVDENEGFIFNVTGPDNMQFTVSVKGNGTAMISGLPIGIYSVAEDTSWSWRYTASVSPASVELSSTNPSSTVTVTNTKGNSGWLGGEAYAQNVVSNTPAEPAP